MEEKYCHYLNEKEIRDQVRRIIQNKIMTVDEVISELYKIVEAEQKQNKEINKSQDAAMVELKGYVQEISAHQQITHTDVVAMKKEMEKFYNELLKLSGEMHNGFPKKIMAEAYNNTVKQNNEMMNKIIEIVQQNSQNNSETIQKQNENNTSVWKGIFGKGGIAAALIGLGALVIKLILG